MSTRLALFGAFVATVYGANLALEHLGTITLPGIGWQAPAGVLFAGLAFGIRDRLHDEGGARLVLAAIAAGAALSYALSDAVSIPGGATSIAVASGIAFAVAELADLAVYAPLRRRHWVAGVIASNLVGAVIDSVLFLELAFGSSDLAGGQIAGKAAMIVPGALLVWHGRRERRVCWACDGATDEERHTCRALRGATT